MNSRKMNSYSLLTIPFSTDYELFFRKHLKFKKKMEIQ